MKGYDFKKSMAKFTNPSKLSKEDQEQILICLCEAISTLRDSTEAARFLKDLLSSQEVEMIAKRFKIAQMLVENHNYSQIMAGLKVSSNTIARVHEWLKISGDGFQIAMQRIPKKPAGAIQKSPINIKRKFPLYYWPELLLETIVKSAREKEKKEIRKALNSMDKKAVLYKRLSKLM